MKHFTNWNRSKGLARIPPKTNKQTGIGIDTAREHSPYQWRDTLADRKNFNERELKRGKYLNMPQMSEEELGKYLQSYSRDKNYENNAYCGNYRGQGRNNYTDSNNGLHVEDSTISVTEDMVTKVYMTK